MGGGTRAREGGSKGFGAGGVGGRGTGQQGRSKFRKLRRISDVEYAVGWGCVQGLGGGRGTGPRDGANFATCVVFLTFLMCTKRRKIAFFEGCPVGFGEGGPRASVLGG